MGGHCRDKGVRTLLTANNRRKEPGCRLCRYALIKLPDYEEDTIIRSKRLPMHYLPLLTGIKWPIEEQVRDIERQITKVDRFTAVNIRRL